MKIELTAGFLFAFISLHFVMHEAHELAHTIVGRMICGCWGERDFNVWNLCNDCNEQYKYSVLATFTGPIFTFLMIWTGVYFLRTNRIVRQKSFGFALVFANIPFARIFTAIMGRGDEIYGLTKLMHNHRLGWFIGLSLILLLTIYPLYRAFVTITNKNKVGYFILFLLTPMMVDFVFVFGVMNTFLKKEVLSYYWILGSPLLVTVFSCTMLVVLALTRMSIYKLSE